MAQPIFDLSSALASIDAAVGTLASATAFVNGVGGIILAAVVKAVEEDDAADQGTVDAVKAAVEAKIADMNTNAAALATALANHNPPTPPMDPSARRGR